MAMIARAQRPAIGHQIRLVAERALPTPAAAHGVVAARGERAGGRGRRFALRALRGHVQHVLAAVQIEAFAQQVAVAAHVAVGERRHLAVGLVRVHREFQRAHQAGVHARRQLDRVQHRQALHAQPVAQHDVVVVGGELALHAVLEQVGGDVAGDLLQREFAPLGGRCELGEHHARQEHRVQLERAVIARRVQIAPQVFGLFVQRHQKPFVERRGDAGGPVAGDEEVVRVDPVLDAPAGDVGGDEPRRSARNPRIGQRHPFLYVALIARLVPARPEPDRVVELVQQDVPLDIGAWIVEPGDRLAQRMGLAVEAERVVEQRIDALAARLLRLDDREVLHAGAPVEVLEQRRRRKRAIGRPQQMLELRR